MATKAGCQIKFGREYDIIIIMAIMGKTQPNSGHSLLTYLTISKDGDSCAAYLVR